MSDFPDIPTISDILGEVILADGSNLDRKQIDRLLRLKKGDKTPMFDIDEKELILNTIAMIDRLGFEKALEYIRDESNREDSEDVIINSPLFIDVRRNNFLELTKGMVIKKITQSIYTCVDCGSKDINVIIAQTRGSDEGATTFFKCRACGSSNVKT